MEQFKKLHSHSKFKENIADIAGFLDKAIGMVKMGNQKFMVPGMSKAENAQNIQIIRSDLAFDATGLKNQLNTYNNYITQLYTKKNGKYPSLSADSLKLLKETAAGLLAQLDNVKKNFKDNGLVPENSEVYFDQLRTTISADLHTLSKIELRGRMTLPQAVYKESGKAFEIDSDPANSKGVSFFEYSKMYAGKSKSEKSVVREYMNTPADQLMAKYKAYIEDDISRYEYSSVNTIIPEDILLTGDPEKIDEYLNSDAAKNLTYSERLMLTKHKEATVKSNEIHSSFNENPDMLKNQAPDVTENDTEARINTGFDSHQSSGAGCWSCAGEALLKSKGINYVSQEDIRAYRPKLPENEIVDGEFKKQYTSDTIGNVMDKADSILAFAPNCMMKEIQVLPYDEQAENAGYTMEQYINNTARFLADKIRYAITVDHSAVAFLKPGHYVTVTGIKGDTIEYKESKGGTGFSADHTFTMSLNEFVKNQFMKTNTMARRPVSISWMADIKINKDNNTIYGVPSEYTALNEDGTIKLPPEDIQAQATANMSSLNKEGVLIQRYAGKEQGNLTNEYTDGGIVKIERAYLPKKLNYDFLKIQAANRENHEERKLNELDKASLGIDRTKFGIAPDAENNAAININEIKPEEKHYTLKEMVDTVVSMKANLKAVSPKWLLSNSPESDDVKVKLQEFETDIKALNDAAKTGVAADNALASNAGKSINLLIKSLETYLDHKHQQMKEDPGRRNAYKRSITEQPRIKNAINMLENLYTMRISLKGKNMEGADLDAEYQYRNDVLNEYRNSLLSDKERGITPKMVQEATYKNHLKGLNNYQLNRIERFEAILGMSPDNSKFKGAEIAEYKDPETGKKTSEFNKLTTIRNTFIPIGPADPMDRLSNKDFTAIAFAASTTREAYDCVERTQNHHGLMSKFITQIGDNIYNERINDFTTYEKSRQLTANALTEYKNGNKQPLAKIIAQGLENMFSLYRNYAFSYNVNYLYMSEMGNRLYSMLKRDPELFKLAKKEGLSKQGIDVITITEMVGRYGDKAAYDYTALGHYVYSKTAVDKNKYPLFDINDTVEFKTDMILGRMIKDSEKAVLLDLKDNTDYKKGLAELEIASVKKTRDVSNDILNTLNQAFSGDLYMFHLITAYSVRQESVYLTVQNGIAEKKDEEDLDTRQAELEEIAGNYRTDTVSGITALLPGLKDYKDKLTAEYNKQDKLKSQNKLNKEGLKKHKDLKKKCAAIGKAIKEIERIQWTISIYGEDYKTELTNKYLSEDNNFYELSKPSKKYAIRKKVRDYVVKYGIDQLDNETFLENVYDKHSNKMIYARIKADQPWHGDNADHRVILPKNDSGINNDAAFYSQESTYNINKNAVKNNNEVNKNNEGLKKK